MRDMMNMVITDNELDNVNGGVAKSVNSYSIQHALARNVQGTPNIATKKSGTNVRHKTSSDPALILTSIHFQKLNQIFIRIIQIL